MVDKNTNRMNLHIHTTLEKGFKHSWEFYLTPTIHLSKDKFGKSLWFVWFIFALEIDFNKQS